MQGTMATPSKDRQDFVSGTIQKRNSKRDCKSQKAVAKVREPVNGFLTSVFKPIHVTEINPLFKQDNYQYLYNSAKKYAALLGENFTLEPDPQNFEAVCDKLDDLLPGGQGVRLYEKDSKLEMKVIDCLDYNILYYIPCKIIKETEGVFKDILIEFFRLLQYKQSMTPLLESQHFEMWKDEVENYRDNTGEELDEDWVATIDSYTTGEINETLTLIDQKPQYEINDLEVIIKGYAPSNKSERKILKYIKKGLKFLNTGKKLLHYTNAPRGNVDDRAVDADNIFMIVYDDDVIVEQLIVYMNDFAMETGYEFFSSIDKTITTRTKALVKPDKFIPDFLKWINDFIYVLYHR